MVKHKIARLKEERSFVIDCFKSCLSFIPIALKPPKPLTELIMFSYFCRIPISKGIWCARSGEAKLNRNDFFSIFIQRKWHARGLGSMVSYVSCIKWTNRETKIKKNEQKNLSKWKWKTRLNHLQCYTKVKLKTERKRY